MSLSSFRFNRCQKIKSLDLSTVAALLESRKGWDRGIIDPLLEQYRIFLYLKRKYPSVRLLLSVELDEVWHFHILCTKQYMEDCHNVFGHYLHHNPQISLREDELADRCAETKKLINSEFPELG